MASFQMNENSIQCMTCKCDDGDQNIWTTRASENSDNQSNSCHNCETLKSGPLFISSKGIGWTSWKKRWFILSRKSLMFYRVDPNALPQKGSEAPNPTLGGIELNNSGSVIVKTDKKLLTVLFPDGRDGRAFTLKTETLDELNEWKAALEGALAQAPSANQVMGHSGLFLNEAADSIEAAFEQFKDKPPTTSSVIGRPVLLALEEIDGSPSFLEKAFRFIEEQGVKVEGILRQSADVEEVMQRVQEYEQGKTEFTADEDAHVIGDCIKHVLREMPSSPVPASCCMSLVDAYRTSRGSMVKNIRHAIYETFPEPNRRLLQRTLQMILNVAAHKAENRMSLPALAACMAPLLLRPLLAGECELNNGFQIDRDGSYQLLQAAAAANHAQAIVIVLLEKYKIIFNDESFSSELYTESEDEGIEGDESTDNEISKEAGYHDAQNDRKAEGDTDVSYSGTPSGSDNDVDSEDSSDLVGGVDSEVDSDVGSDIGSDVGSDKGRDVGNNIRSDAGNIGGNVVRNDAASDIERKLSIDQDIKDINAHSTSAGILSTVVTNKFGNIKPSSSSIIKSADQSNEAQPTMRNKWGRTSARKNLSVESIEYINDDESAVQRLESAKIDLQKQLSEEIKGNVVLQSSLDGRKQALHERRLALEKEVVRLKELLQKERDLRLHLESGLMSTQPDNLSTSACLDSKIMADLEEIALSLRDIDNLKLNIIDLAEQLQGRTTCCQSCGQPICRSDERLEDANIIPNEHKKDNSLKPSILLTAQRAKQTLKDEAKSNMKDEAKNSTFLKERQTYQNILPRISNHSVARYSETSLAEDRHSTSKKLLRWECSRKDALEPSSSRRVSAQQKQSIISSSKSEKSKEMDSSIFSEEQTTLLHNNATRRHASKSEEGISSSFALTKLTNRLNFLKERRAQLANEVQNLDSDRATGSEAPLKTNNN